MRQADAVKANLVFEEKRPGASMEEKEYPSCVQGTEWGARKRSIRSAVSLGRDEEAELFGLMEIGKKADAYLSGSLDEAESGVFAPGFSALDAASKRRLCAGLSLRGRYARSRIIEASLPQVVLLAEKTHRLTGKENHAVGEEDLFSEGYLALEEAVGKFDREKGSRLKTFAEKGIRGAMRRFAQRNGRNARVPAWAQEFSDKAKRVRAELASELNRAPSDKEVAEKMGVAVKRLRETELFCLEEASLDAPRGEDGAPALFELLPGSDALTPEVLFERQEMGRLEAKVLSELEDRERAAFRMYHGIGCKHHTFKEIGAELALSTEGARKLYKRAKGRACRGAKKYGLEAFLKSA